MRQHYRNLFGSCLLAALILPSQHAGAAPLQESTSGLRTDWSASSRAGADQGLAGVHSQKASLGRPVDGLQEGVNARSLAGPGREPILGKPPAPNAALPAQPALQSSVQQGSATAMVSAAARTPPRPSLPLMSAMEVVSPLSPQAALTYSGSKQVLLAETDGQAPPSGGFAAPRPAMPQALADALAALSQKKIDDAIRLAGTFISQAEAKGPGPDNTPPVMAVAHEILGTAYAMQGKQQEGAEELLKAIAINPAQVSALFKAGVVYRDMGKLPEAKTYLEKARDAGGGDPVKLYLGDVYERLGDIPGAITAYEPLLVTARGDDIKFKGHLASLYDRVGRFPDAIKLLESSVTPETQDAQALLALGVAYAGTGKPKEGVKFLAAAKALQPDNIQIDLALGTSQRDAGDLDGAQTSLKRVLDVQPNQVQALFQLGLVQMAKQQFRDAADTLAQAVKLAPNAVELKRLLGDALFAAGKKDESIEQFKMLVGRDGAVLADYVNLARAYQLNGQPDQAAEIYSEATRKFPPNPAIFALLGQLQGQQKKFTEARATIAEGRKLNPDDPRLLQALIQVEMTAGAAKSALPAAERLAEVQPQNVDSRFLLATVYGQVGEHKKAISIYRGLLNAMPENPIVLNNLASSLVEDGDAKSALPVAKRALELQPKNPAINDTYGWALLKTGQAKESMPLLETASQTDPKNPEMIYHLAMAQKALNNPKAARANLEKALALGQDFNGAAQAKAALASLPK